MTENSDLAIAIDLMTDLATSDGRVRDCLAAEGFGVLTEIDVQATLKAKLGLDVPGYRILGACNPSLAHRTISADPIAGILLPCNVVLRETRTGTRVEIANPIGLLKVLDSRALRGVAEEAHHRLARVASELSSGANPATGPAPTASVEGS